MAKHNVRVSVPKSTSVVNADIKFDVKRNGKKIGTLKVSKGGVQWVKGKKKGPTKSWVAFGEWALTKPKSKMKKTHQRGGVRKVAPRHRKRAARS